MSEADEVAARDQGQVPKVGHRSVQAKGCIIEGQEEVTYLVRNDCAEILDLQDTMCIKEVAHEVAEVCPRRRGILIACLPVRAEGL